MGRRQRAGNSSTPELYIPTKQQAARTFIDIIVIISWLSYSIHYFHLSFPLLLSWMPRSIYKKAVYRGECIITQPRAEARAML